MKTNPLQNFLRQPKFHIQLPSQGHWYPANACNHQSGSVAIYAMTASDDIRFKNNELLLSGTGAYDLIKSCVPEIRDPEQMPIIDFDIVLLNIRRASYGNQYRVKLEVPNTQLTRTVELNIQELTNTYPNAKEIWDPELIIINDQNQALKVQVKPINLKSMFQASKQLIRQSQISNDIVEKIQYNDDKLQELDTQMKTLSSITVNTISDGIERLEFESFSTSNVNEIKQFITQIDLAYFNAIKNHIETQREKIAFKPLTLTATPEEKSQGAPDTWEAKISFNLANLFESHTDTSEEKAA